MGGNRMADAEGATKSSKLAAKDWIGIVFSLAALLLSGASFVLSNRVDERVLARVADIAEDTDDRGYDTYRVEMALANVGNRPAIVSEASMFIGATEKDAIPAHATASDLPLVIQPREVKLVSISVPVAMLQGVPSKGGNDAVETPQGPRLRTNGYVLFRTFGSRGQVQEKLSGPLVRGDTTPDLKTTTTTPLKEAEGAVLYLLRGSAETLVHVRVR